MEPFVEIHTGPYKGDVSALCLLPSPGQGRFPFLLAGMGPQLLLFDTGSFELLLSSAVFEGVRVHGIEVRPQCLVQEGSLQNKGLLTTLCVHGERMVKLFNLALENELSNQKNNRDRIPLNLSHTLPRFNHWVLDVRFLKEAHDYRGASDIHQFLAVGTTDNSVYVWCMSKCAFLLCVNCAERCLLYSLRFWGNSLKKLKIASGTIFNEIVIWDLSIHISNGTCKENILDSFNSFKESTCVAAPLKQRLKGHEGSIFRITWSQDGRMLASVSDDRSVRVWDIQELCDFPLVSAGTQPDSVCLASVMYGHTARIWDCHFDSKFLITVSEDCTYRIWTIKGHPLVKKVAHLGRGIWRCVFDTVNAVLFTAGADSSIKAHFLGKWLSVTDEVDQGQDLFLEPSPSLELFCVESPEATAYSRRKEQLDSKSEYVRCLSLAGPTCLYVTTNQGVLKCVHFGKGVQQTWSDLFCNLNFEPIICLDILRIKQKPQKNNAMDAFEDCIAMGDYKGYVTILCGSWIGELFHQSFMVRWQAEDERKLLGVFWSRHSGFSSVFTADTSGALTLWRLEHSIVRTLEENSFYIEPMSVEASKFGYSLAVRCQSSFKVRIVCLDICLEEELLVCGDQRGNIAVFSLSVAAPQNIGRPPLASFKGAHGISAVASLCVIGKRNKDQIKIFSTGRDGCICTFAFQRSGARLFCLRVEKLSAITLVESYAFCNGIIRRASARRIVAGFLADEFIIYDLQNDCEIARVSCGGWRRPHDHLIGTFPEIQHCFVFIKEGVLYVLRKWLEAPNVLSPLLSFATADRSSFLSSLFLQSQFHGREIHSVKFIGRAHTFTEHKDTISWMSTGGEDGVVRVLRFKDDTFEHFDASQVLGEHVGGSAVREVTVVTDYCVCNGHCLTCKDGAALEEPSCMLISAGAKEVLTCWLLEWEVDFKSKDPTAPALSSRWLSTKRYSKTRSLKAMPELDTKPFVLVDGIERQNSFALEAGANDDLRYLAMTSFSVFCPENRLQTFFAATASSNATVMLYAFQIPIGDWVELCFLTHHKALVLTLEHLVIRICGVEQQMAVLQSGISQTLFWSFATNNWDTKRKSYCVLLVDVVVRVAGVGRFQKIIIKRKRTL